ncbi:MAG: hypothetical protein CMI94_01535, partial [Pelagibacteraceae bacterium]|nr:hypothetical protein [Pelagibacteraceae bacterium]
GSLELSFFLIFKKFFIFCITFLKVSINKNELDPFLKYWEKKADLISIQNPSNPFDGKLFETKRKWLGIKKSKNETKVSNKVSYEQEFDDMKRCAQPNQRLVIDSDGTVHPCCNFRGKEINIGNAFKDTIHSIWNNKKYTELRKIQKKGEYKKNKVCKVCIDHGSNTTPDV